MLFIGAALLVSLVYADSNSVAERKKAAGAKIISASATNIYFQGLKEVTGGNTANTEKSCLLEAQDAKDGWSFRLAVLNTPAKIQMVNDAYKAKVMNGDSYIGAKPVGRKAGATTGGDPEHFSWSTCTPVDTKIWGKNDIGGAEPDNYWDPEDYVYIDQNAKLYDVHEITELKPLCEYYKNTLAERKKAAGVKILSATECNVFFQGLKEVSGGKTADAEKSCFVAAQDAQEGWSFRLAVLDTPAKIQMMLDAYKKKVLSSGSIIGAKAVGRTGGAAKGADPEHFFWSTGAPVNRAFWGRSGYGTQEPNNLNKHEDYVYIDVNAKLHDIDEKAKNKPICEFYRS